MDQTTAVFVAPDTAIENGKESPARMFAVGGETVTLTEEGCGVEFVPAEQPVADSAAKMLPRWSNLRISERMDQQPRDTVHSVRGGTVKG